MKRIFLLILSIVILIYSSFTLAFGTSAEELIRAASFDDPDKIQSLIKEGVDLNSRDKMGNTALLTSLREKSSKSAMLLLKQDKVDVELENNAGESPLMLAALQGLEPEVKFLVEERHAEVNKKGWTALHYAASTGKTQIAQYLLEKSAYIDAESPNGTTPLMMAVRGDHIQTVKLLLDEGADLRLKNQQGMTAIDFAKRYHREEIEEGLTSRLQKLNGDKKPSF